MLSNLELKQMIQTPPLRRFSMAYRPFISQGKLRETLILRRALLWFLVLGSSVFAARMIHIILSSDGPSALKWVIEAMFTVLFAWISVTFWTAFIGFIVLMAKHDPFLSDVPVDKTDGELSASATVAIVMPVYNEDVGRVFAGLQVMHESLQRTGELGRFHFFILSDTNNASHWQQEESAWRNLCEKVDGMGRIFYRRRKLRIHQKSGNIADFCRRWGSQYKYMIILDADSLMTGQLMVDMTRIMEKRPDIGILQTAPKGINQQSLGSRINQFTSHLYGPLLLAGSYFTQLEDAGFWGHNAIIRLEPFMKFCALPKLSGSLPFGGPILSHDFIEAALMRRAGWGVWLAYGLEDSYEELPPNLLKELERDCRWCRGNIQHLRLMLMKGISLGHRFLFLNGNMFYFSALLWLTMLILMTVYAISQFFHTSQYFPQQHRLFPDWPTHYPHLSMELLGVTAVFLYLPKILSIIWVLASGRSSLFGGPGRVIISVWWESIFSIFLAPIRMVFHSWFVATAFLGGKFDWKKQPRSHEALSFVQAFKAQWLISLMALIWAFVAFEVNHVLFLWLSVIVLPLLLSVPLSMLMSDARAGLFFKKAGFFLTPMETRPLHEIIRLQQLV